MKEGDAELIAAREKFSGVENVDAIPADGWTKSTLRGRPENPRRPVSYLDTAAEDQIFIAVPALVSEELFTAVQAQLHENRLRKRAVIFQSGQHGLAPGRSGHRPALFQPSLGH